jgi:large conductance mechanosensitive channel
MSSWNNPLNNPTVSNVGKRAKGTLNDFQQFILRGNVVDLAIGIIIGAAFSSVVTGLVNDIITPLIPTTKNSSLATWSYPIGYSGSKLLVGPFIQTIITFLILALVIFFFVVKPVNALMNLHKSKEPAAPTTRDCPFCLSSVPIQATRCAYCTSQLPSVVPPPPAPQGPQQRR